MPPQAACLRSSAVRLDCRHGTETEAGLDPEDAQLFREAIGEVRRIEAPPAAPAPAPPPPRARRFELDEEEALRESRLGGAEPIEGDELLAWRRDHVSEGTLRRLRRGEYSTQDELDLHHLRAQDAESCSSLPRRGARRLAPVRAHHPWQGPALGRRAGAEDAGRRVLRLRGDVLAFASAPPAQGGAGAVLVLLDYALADLAELGEDFGGVGAGPRRKRSSSPSSRHSQCQSLHAHAQRAPLLLQAAPRGRRAGRRKARPRLLEFARRAGAAQLASPHIGPVGWMSCARARARLPSLAGSGPNTLCVPSSIHTSPVRARSPSCRSAMRRAARH
jgi:DNA-nicking Smr family endonuclease